jgi:hypothetical protein
VQFDEVAGQVRERHHVGFSDRSLTRNDGIGGCEVLEKHGISSKTAAPV